MAAASDKRFFKALDASLRDADVPVAEHAIDETIWWAVHALRDRDDSALRVLAESCNVLGQRYKSSDGWRGWCAGQLQMIASLCRSALSLQLPWNIAAAIRERKNFLPILQAVGERDVDVSTVASAIGLSVTQTLRELMALEELKLVQTDKSSRRRWVRVTPLGHRAIAELAPAKREVPQVGDVVTGTVTKIREYGAFVDIGEGIEGLVHITDITDRSLRHPSEVMAVDDRVDVKILKIDGQRYSLSMKDVGSALEPSRDTMESEEAPDTELAHEMEKAFFDEAG